MRPAGNRGCAPKRNWPKRLCELQKRPVIALLDYGAGNVRSVQKALTAAGGDVQLVPSPELVKQADAVVLPGVGAFDDCINAMQQQDLFEAAREFVFTGKPFLGICVDTKPSRTVRNSILCGWPRGF